MQERQLVVSSLANSYVRTVTSLTPRTFVDYSLAENQGDFLIITSALLTSASGSGDPVEEYRQYRASSTGGSYNAKIYLFDQLEDQFGFGISMNPAAIRNFVHWARSRFTQPLRSVFLVGKACTYNQYYLNRNSPDVQRLCMVPTFGNPASDNLFTAVRTSSIPLVPDGRLSVIDKAEVSTYLKKVKEYEQLYDYNSPLVAEKRLEEKCRTRSWCRRQQYQQFVDCSPRRP